MRIRERYFFVYFMSNRKRNVLYIGITANLLKRQIDPSTLERTVRCIPEILPTVLIEDPILY